MQRLQDYEVSVLEEVCEVDAVAPHLRILQDFTQDGVAQHLGNPKDFMREDEMDAAGAHLRLPGDFTQDAAARRQ